MDENEVIMQRINPKSVSLTQLYGVMDNATGEWSYGILSLIFRNLSRIQNKKRKWFLFDGPVDAIWIENMNTVLDDN